ncbi:neuromedin-U isoform X2 [Cyclopterus lumpus]|uniref:neuromedin-U isoform X2 n=1 Tax=Cyclopterus lumpus TaxID=8103 RepID=UPI001485DEF8|nr:neuromedin-U isoform X2 [Cyclopterus lumpus]
MRTFQTQSQAAQRGASSSSVSPLSAASVALTALLILTVPVCKSAPAEPPRATTDQRQLLSRIDAVCSSYLSADLKFWTSDILGELCVSMLVQKSKDLAGQENNKRTPMSHPLLHLVSQLHTRRERGLSTRVCTPHGELPGPGGIQSRGYFLYRPRNGRRFLEYE